MTENVVAFLADLDQARLSKGMSRQSVALGGGGGTRSRAPFPHRPAPFVQSVILKTSHGPSVVLDAAPLQPVIEA